jgi:hypothetical protein
LISRAPLGALGRIEHHKLLEVLGRGALGFLPPFDGASWRWLAVKGVVTPLLMMAQSPAKKEGKR